MGQFAKIVAANVLAHLMATISQPPDSPTRRVLLVLVQLVGGSDSYNSEQLAEAYWQCLFLFDGNDITA